MELELDMELERDLIVFDLETTGLSFVKDCIIEISMIKYTTKKEIIEKIVRFKNTAPISPEAFEVHGISEEDLKDEKPFKRYAKGMLAFMDGCDLVSYNAHKLDIPMLVTEFERCDLELKYLDINIIDPYTLYVRNEKRDLESAYLFYCGKKIDGNKAHNALYDSQVLLEVFNAQLKYYELKSDVKSLEELATYTNYDKKVIDVGGLFVYDENGDVVINKGANKGLKIEDRTKYLEYVFQQSDFIKNTKDIAEGFYNEIMRVEREIEEKLQKDKLEKEVIEQESVDKLEEKK